MTIALRPAGPGDYPHVIALVDDWWGGRAVAAMLPKLFFIHFPDTTVVAVEPAPDGGDLVVGFLCGFVSRADPAVGYIHFVGVDPAVRGRAVGRTLYEWFFDRVASMGCTRVECVTSPINDGSRAFHAAMGFSERMVDDYDGLGQPRMVLQRDLRRAACSAGGS